MHRFAHRIRMSAVAAVAAGTVVGALGVPGPAAANNTFYYVDCTASANGNGTYGSPWNNLQSANNGPGGSSANPVAYAPGDGIWLRRGTTCAGSLNPRGNGSSGSPVYIGSYGSGAAAKIDATGHSYGVKLYNQHHWQIENLEVFGSQDYGIWISGDVAGNLDWFRLINLTVRDVGVGRTTETEKGLVFIVPDASTTNPSTFLNDILIDNVTAYNTTHWQGIRVGRCGRKPTISCGDNDNRSGVTRASNAVIRNSTVHDTGGDGILVMQTNASTVENNVVYNTGKATSSPDEWGWSPVGIWTWNCDGCTMQANEIYNAGSFNDKDGGGVDIDTLSQNSTAQYNYAHDNEGYCVSVFGAYGVATTNSVVRYNVCANNSRRSTNSGDFYLTTWDSGTLDGVQIYNNTTYWNPAGNKPALASYATFSGSRTNFFRNNLIRSDNAYLVRGSSAMPMNNNLYWYTGTGSPSFEYGGSTYTGFSAYRTGSGQDGAGRYADPRLNSPTYSDNGKPTTQLTLQPGSPAFDAGATISGNGGRDFFGNTVPQGSATDIGAHELPNRVRNATFEFGTGSVASDWTVSGSAAYRDGNTPYSGAWKGVHYGSSAYEVLTSQSLTGLTPGRTYTLTAQVASSGGQLAAGMGLKNCGDGVDHWVDLAAVGTSWTQRQTSVTLPTGSTSCLLYFYSKTNTSARWLSFDNVVVN